MRVELKSPQDYEAIQKAWKEINAPCYIRATGDPKKFTIIPRKGVSSEMVNFFLIDQMSEGEDRETEKARTRSKPRSRNVHSPFTLRSVLVGGVTVDG